MLSIANIARNVGYSERTVENFGRLGRTTITYIFEDAEFPAPLVWQSSLRAGSVEVDFDLDNETGSILGLEVMLDEIPKLDKTVLPIAGNYIYGLPVADLLRLPASSRKDPREVDRRFDECKFNIGRVNENTVLVYLDPLPSELIWECSVCEKLSIYIDKFNAIVAMRIGVLTCVDNMVIKQAELRQA